MQLISEDLFGEWFSLSDTENNKKYTVPHFVYPISLSQLLATTTPANMNEINCHYIPFSPGICQRVKDRPLEYSNQTIYIKGFLKI